MHSIVCCEGPLIMFGNNPDKGLMDQSQSPWKDQLKVTLCLSSHSLHNTITITTLIQLLQQPRSVESVMTTRHPFSIFLWFLFLLLRIKRWHKAKKSCPLPNMPWTSYFLTQMTTGVWTFLNGPELIILERTRMKKLWIGLECKVLNGPEYI